MTELRDILDGLADIRNAFHTGRFGQREVWEKHLEDASEALSRLTVSPLPEEIAKHIENLHNAADVHEERGNLVTAGKYRTAAAALEQMGRENAHLEKVIAARDEQLTAEIKATGNLAKELEQMGRENERLKGELSYMTDEVTPANLACIRGLEAALVSRTAERDAKSDVATKLRVRIRELEAERDVARKSDAAKTARVIGLENRLNEIESERDAVKALNKSILNHNGELLRDLGASTKAIKAKTMEECAEALLAKRDALPPGSKDRAGLERGAIIIRALNQPEAAAEGE